MHQVRYAAQILMTISRKQEKFRRPPSVNLGGSVKSSPIESWLHGGHGGKTWLTVEMRRSWVAANAHVCSAAPGLGIDQALPGRRIRA